MITNMVTKQSAEKVVKIGSPQRGAHLYMTEWREHIGKKIVGGLSVEKLGLRIGKSRETVWRWENEQHRLNPEKIALYATGLDMVPEQLFRPPERPSADALLKNSSPAVQKQAIRLVRALVEEEAETKTGTGG